MNIVVRLDDALVYRAAPEDVLRIAAATLPGDRHCVPASKLVRGFTPGDSTYFEQPLPFDLRKLVGLWDVSDDLSLGTPADPGADFLNGDPHNTIGRELNPAQDGAEPGVGTGICYPLNHWTKLTLFLLGQVRRSRPTSLFPP